MVRFWDVAASKEASALAGHRGWVWSVAFSPDGKLLASGSFDDTIRLWDVQAILKAGK
jgi:WD40 repeat protein